MFLVDANIFMYAAGADHPHKEPSLAFLRRIATGGVDAVIDAEVLQEILHRYRAIGRWDEGGRVFDLARRIVPAVAPITVEIVERAREILDAYTVVTARDALHAAACQAVGAESICSYDRDFDKISGVTRISP